jgi:tRNA pseudouridine38-40 synthase
VPRYKLTIEFAGTKYSGWQKQKNARTVQGELENAIAEFTRDTTFEFMGSGRTDAGVHALRQVAHLDVRKALPAESLRRGINDALPADIHVLAVDSVPHRFHARHSAIARSYLYQVSRRRTAFAKPFVWWVKEPLDLDRMKDAAARFTGMHDFQSYSDDDPEEKSTDVLVEDIAIAEDGDLILIRVGGSHFIWKMVRRMVGVLVETGKGAITADQVWSVDAARLTAPASGLFLERVFYDGDSRQQPLQPAAPVRPARG